VEPNAECILSAYRECKSWACEGKI
jgi:hypothetical protein